MRALFRRRSPLLLLAAALVALAVFSAPGAQPASAEHRLRAPWNLVATPGDRSVTLTWGGNSDGTYTVRYGVHPSGALATQVTGRDARTHTISGLTPGTTYRFQVRADGHSGHTTSAYTRFVRATTLVWSATLTVGSYDGSTFGCWVDHVSSDCSSTSVLTDNDFTFKGVNYEIQGLLVKDQVHRLEYQSLVLRLDKKITADLRAALTLHVGQNTFALVDATVTFDDLRAQWYHTGLRWSPLQQVSLSLSITDPPTTRAADLPVLPSVPRQPIDDSVQPVPASERTPDGGSASDGYCYLGVGNPGTDYVRYPDGTIRETTAASTVIRSLYACD